MKHQGTRRFETERLLLRPFETGDAEAMFRNWASDPAVTEYLTWPAHADVEETRAVLSCWVRDYENPEVYQWAVVPKALGEPIGSLSVVRIDEKVDAVELGWCIGRPWWGQGLMPEAAARVLRYLIAEVGANRVAARHAAGNPKSGRVMQKLGMSLEGVLRQADRSNHGIEDMVCYSILASEYREKNP